MKVPRFYSVDELLDYQGPVYVQYPTLAGQGSAELKLLFQSDSLEFLSVDSVNPPILRSELVHPANISITKTNNIEYSKASIFLYSSTINEIKACKAEPGFLERWKLLELHGLVKRFCKETRLGYIPLLRK